MDSEWKVTVWGVRGSAPRPSRACMEYGGNTVCTTVEQNGQLTVLDCGSGLACLGQALARRPQLRRLDMLVSHPHMDHIQGLLTFPALFDRDMELCLYGADGLQACIERLLSPPFWPVGMEKLAAKLTFGVLRPGDRLALGGLTVSVLAGNHPGGSLLYRLDGQGKSLTYALDCETDPRILPDLCGFARGSDLLVWDADFAPQDLRPGWGHSTWKQGIDVGAAAGVKRVLMTHYSWEYTDDFLHGEQTAAARYAQGRVPACLFAREGAEIPL